ncbi:hypothetical protein E4T52_03314 [Aureobasidium sp. EXF-3400]|nr:hypothetical protein E4T51_02573 [Aureobasidium sp. EXF-12344]KAI4781783.1 hypothetical protein E4T52_03314 [Aureobasidium sp. EXF-3400]
MYSDTNIDAMETITAWIEKESSAFERWLETVVSNPQRHEVAPVSSPKNASSSSARSDLSNRSFLSASSSTSPRPTPSVPSPSVYGNLLSPADTPHKRNRFKTLFFAPSIRDSGISLSTPTSDPRFPSPVTPPCFPIPGVPIDEEALVQEELDFLVDELASRYACCDSRDQDFTVSDRCDSPTLGYSSITMASRSHVPLPMREKNDGNNNSKSRGHISALPGASHLNSPVDLSIHELATNSTSINAKKTSPRPRPAINPSSPLLGLPHVFRRLAITDPHINGQPIRFLSQDYVAGANSLQVGSCTFMNLPYGADVECGLRVEPNFPRHASKSQTVILQIVQRVVRVRDGSSVWLLCSEVDVSSSFTAQVREELALAASANALSNGKAKQKQRVSDDDIWVSLAQQLETDSYAPSTTRLPTHSTNTKNKSTTTPALSDLLSLLTELRFLHRQFFVLQPKKSKTGDVGLSIPYLSSSLHTSLLSLPHSNPSREEKKHKDTPHGHDTSIYTSNLASNTPLATFINTATFAAKTWLGSSAQPSTILREVLSLPPMGKNKEGKEEQIGIYGVRVGESWGEGRQGLGCWVCFLVPKGVEKEL